MITSFWWQSVLWIIGACGLGFAIAAIFGGWLRLPRNLFLVPYVTLASAFLTAYFVWSKIGLVALLVDNWAWGVLAGVAVGAITIANVRTQPATRQSTGGELVADLAWLGLAYGLVDGLFLNVMPVLAVWEGLAFVGWSGSVVSQTLLGVLALTASLAVTFSYHVGYPEFRNRSVGLVLLGNGLTTLAFLLSGNPLGAIIAHVVMHLAAVLRGPDTTLQLPPHPATPSQCIGALTLT